MFMLITNIQWLMIDDFDDRMEREDISFQQRVQLLSTRGFEWQATDNVSEAFLGETDYSST